MTRDEFAAKALQGLCANPGGPYQANGRSGWGIVNCTPDHIAEEAYLLADAMVRAAAKAEPAEDAAGWQPIETAPKDGTRFLAFYKGAVNFFHWQDFRDGGDSPIGWRDSFINVYREGTGPTHWMPLPNAPEAEAERKSAKGGA